MINRSGPEDNTIFSCSVDECLKIVRRIDIITGKRNENLGAGVNKSLFKGRGLEIADTREYVPGDDIRAMDWKITARYNRPYVRIFNEDRDRTIYIAVDISASGSFGADVPKGLKILEAAATFIFSSERDGDPVGLILFTDKVEIFIPAGKGRRHCIGLISRMIACKPSSKKTDIQKAVSFLGRKIRRKGCIVIISDFDSPGVRESIAAINSRHEIQAVVVADGNEFELPDAGEVGITDPETGEYLLVDTSDKNIRRRYSEISGEFLRELSDIFQKNDIRYTIIRTQEPYMQVLQSLEMMGGGGI